MCIAKFFSFVFLHKTFRLITRILLGNFNEKGLVFFKVVLVLFHNLQKGHYILQNVA